MGWDDQRSCFRVTTSPKPAGQRDALAALQHVVQAALDSAPILEQLQKYQYKDEGGKDWVRWLRRAAAALRGNRRVPRAAHTRALGPLCRLLRLLVLAWQGLNVRNRAKEICELLARPDRIREERAKARSNKDKYTGGGQSAQGGKAVASSGNSTGPAKTAAGQDRTPDSGAKSSKARREAHCAALCCMGRRPGAAGAHETRTLSLCRAQWPATSTSRRAAPAPVRGWTVAVIGAGLWLAGKLRAQTASRS